MAIAPKTNPNETPAETFERWLADGSTWIACFENQDLGHRDVGRRICIPYDDAQYEGGQLGITRAPDRADIGLGWRYILKAKVRTAERAAAFLDRKEA
jgi:hypothetical protein